MPLTPMRGGRALPLTVVDAKPYHQGEGEERCALKACPQDGGQEEERHRHATKCATHSPTSCYQPRSGSIAIY